MIASHCLPEVAHYPPFSRNRLVGNLRKVLPDPNKISPHAKPRGSTRSVKTSWGPLIVIAASSALLIVLVLVGLGWSAASERDQLVNNFGEPEPKAIVAPKRPMPPAPPPPPPRPERVQPRTGLNLDKQ